MFFGGQVQGPAPVTNIPVVRFSGDGGIDLEDGILGPGLPGYVVPRLFVPEPTGQASFVVDLPGAGASSTVTIPVSGTNPADGTASPSQIVVTPGQQTQATITVSGGSTAPTGGNQLYQVQFGPMVSSDADWNGFTETVPVIAATEPVFVVGTLGSYTIAEHLGSGSLMQTAGALPNGLSFGFNSTSSTYTITGTPQAGTQGSYPLSFSRASGTTTLSFTLIVDQTTPPALVGNPVINGDNPNGLFTAAGQATAGRQRSMVEDILYTFNEPVTLTSSAFTVAGTGPNPGTAPSSLSVHALSGSNGTQWAVVLDAGNVNATTGLGSIANGEYSITINPADVFAAADGVTPMAPGTGRTDFFYRLFGNVNGAEAVTALDNLQLKKAITIYNPAFDSNADGAVTASDNLLFKKDLVVAFFGDGFVPTI